jgi:hypothetical protein
MITAPRTYFGFNLKSQCFTIALIEAVSILKWFSGVDVMILVTRGPIYISPLTPKDELHP